MINVPVSYVTDIRRTFADNPSQLGEASTDMDLRTNVDTGVNLFLIAENRLLREALTTILRKRNGLRVLGARPYSPELLSEVSQLQPSIVLLEPASLPVPLRQFVGDLRRELTGVAIVLIGMEPDQEVFLALVRAGVSGYVLKDASASEIAAAVFATDRGEAVCPAEMTALLFSYVAHHERSGNVNEKLTQALTARERRILGLLAEGVSNPELASLLGIEDADLRAQVRRIMRKLGIAEREFQPENRETSPTCA